MWEYWIGNVSNEEASIEENAIHLIKALQNAVSGQKVIKTTIFCGCKDDKIYQQVLPVIEEYIRHELGYEVMVSLIPQTPVNASMYLEAWHLPESNVEQITYDSWDNGHLVKISGKFELLLFNSFSLTGEVKRDSQFCFEFLYNKARSLGFNFKHLFRQWNYIGRIFEQANGKQNYQEFNEVRAEFYAKSAFDYGYPAATGIGMNLPGIIIEACFLLSPHHEQQGISNPLQQAAHQYSEKVLIGNQQKRNAPKFERAKLISNHQSSEVYVSGTAAILGEDSLAELNTEEQTRQTLNIIENLVQKQNLKNYNPAVGDQYFYKNVRVYLKNGYFSQAIKALVEKQFAPQQPIYLTADICRDNLLVEVEADLTIK